jgi:hypothetical protein
MLAVLVWGIWLATGAYLGNVKLHHLDVRKGTVVLTCVLGFLGLWAGALMRTKPRHPASPATDEENRRGKDVAAGVPYSKSCVASFLIALVATGLAALVFATRSTMPSYGGWGVAAAVAIATLTAMVGLSDPFLKHGKWMAMVTLLLMGLLVVTWLLVPAQLHNRELPDARKLNRSSAHASRGTIAVRGSSDPAFAPTVGLLK